MSWAVWERQFKARKVISDRVRSKEPRASEKLWSSIYRLFTWRDKGCSIHKHWAFPSMLKTAHPTSHTTNPTKWQYIVSIALQNTSPCIGQVKGVPVTHKSTFCRFTGVVGKHIKLESFDFLPWCLYYHQTEAYILSSKFVNNFGPKAVPGQSDNYQIRKHNRINSWASVISFCDAEKVNIVPTLKHHLGLISFCFQRFLGKRALFKQLSYFFVDSESTCIFNILSWFSAADNSCSTMQRATNGNVTSRVDSFQQADRGPVRGRC